MLTLLLFGQAPTAEAILKRFDQYMKRADSLAITLKARVNGQSIGEGYMKLDRPGRMHLSVKLRGSELAFILNEQEGLELDRGHQAYANHPTYGQLFIPEFKLSQVLNYASPSFLIRGSSRGMFPPDLKPQVTPKVMVNGVSTDILSAKQNGPMGETEMKYWFDSAGRLVKFYSRSASPQGTLVVEHDYSGYTMNPKFASTEFSTKLHLGYMPFSLAQAGYGIPQGEQVPNIQLKNANSGAQTNLTSLTSGANTLVLFADPDFPSNTALLASLKDVVKKVPDSRLIVVGLRRDVASAKKIGASEVYYDPTGTQLVKMAIPAGPTILLIDKKGKLAQMFMGFDGTWEGMDKAIERLKSPG
jgi:hypothetical protein